jgi:Flp pilus assembly pilin Flp
VDLRFLKDERGQTAVEYALVLLIVVAVVAVVAAVDWSTLINSLLDQIKAAL